MTGVQKNVILCDICGHLSGFSAKIACFKGEVSTFIA